MATEFSALAGDGGRPGGLTSPARPVGRPVDPTSLAAPGPGANTALGELLTLSTELARLKRLTPQTVVSEMRPYAPELKDVARNSIQWCFREKHPENWLRRFEICFAAPDWPFYSLTFDVAPEDPEASWADIRRQLEKRFSRKVNVSDRDRFGWIVQKPWANLVQRLDPTRIRIQLFQPDDLGAK